MVSYELSMACQIIKAAFNVARGVRGQEHPADLAHDAIRYQVEANGAKLGGLAVRHCCRRRPNLGGKPAALGGFFFSNAFAILCD